MFFKSGFLGTQAPFYLDFITICFFILPFTLFIAINFVRKKEYKKHFVAQFSILFITIITILLFEIGIRIDGGFEKYSKLSSFNYDFLLTFLLLHVVISICTVTYWIYFIFKSYSNYSSNTLSQKHNKNGLYLFLAICLTSLMGIAVYVFLFVFT